MFVDFHPRSTFSFLQAASLPEDLVQHATGFNHSALALMIEKMAAKKPRQRGTHD